MVADAAVWFVAEVQQGELAPVTHGLAAEARRLARQLGARSAGVLLGHGIEALGAAINADAVLIGEDEALAGQGAEAMTAVLAKAASHRRPTVLLLADTPLGRDLAPRLAARLGTGLASGCLRLDVESDGVLVMLRPAYGGRASCTVAMPSCRPQMATLLPDALAAAGPSGHSHPDTSRLQVDLGGFRPRVSVRGIQRVPPSTLDLAQTEVVVAGGRGAGGPEGFRLLEELAGALGGAVAASRPAVDAGWVPHSRQVGSSGRLVAPRLYIACGISGASQHVVGMRESQLVIAINQDPYAPIVPMAHLSLIGDLRAVLPALLARIERSPGVAMAEEHGPVGDAEPSRPPADLACVAVCLSRSVDPEAPFDLRELDKAPRVLNPPDRDALEEALSLKDRSPQLRVVALHIGPPKGEDVLREALAAGADETVLLWDDGFDGSDSLATARVLAAATRRTSAGLVLCGSRGADGQSGQVPLQMGEMLDAAAIVEVVSMSARPDGSITARRRLQWGHEAVVECRLPAVIGLEPGTNRPRYPRLRDRLAATGRPVQRWGLAELGLSAQDVGAGGSSVRVLRVGPPKPLARSSVAADDELSPEERLQRLLGGGPPAAGQSEGCRKVVQGTPEELAGALLGFLVEHGFARERG